MTILPLGLGTAEKPADAGYKTSAGDYIWLAYSLFFFIGPILKANALYWIENFAIYLVFLVIYFSCMRARTMRRQLLMLSAMGLLGFVTVPFNWSATSFLTFAAALLPFIVESGVVVALVLAGESIAVLIMDLYVHMDWLNTSISLGLIVIVGASNIFIAQKKRASERLSMAHEEIERIAAVAERERIARDLHDVLGHTLSVIVLKTELAGRLLHSNPQAAAQEIAEVERTARAALSEVREAIGGYRTRGLNAEIEQARNTLAAAGVTLTYSVDIKEAPFTATEETVLSLAVREAVTNIVRHARATTCSLMFLTRDDGSRILLVEDDGSLVITPREGNGLRGMRERVQALGGRLFISSGSGSLRGTALRIELPSQSTLGSVLHSTNIVPLSMKSTS